MMTIDNKPRQLFTKDDAIAKAAELQASDPEWTYTPKHCPRGTGHSFIEVHDEDGNLIGRI